jgi:hypothetical protein
MSNCEYVSKRRYCRKAKNTCRRPRKKVGGRRRSSGGHEAAVPIALLALNHLYKKKHMKGFSKRLRKNTRKVRKGVKKLGRKLSRK